MNVEREIEALQREVKELRELTAGIPVRWASGGGNGAGQIMFGQLTSTLSPGLSATMTQYDPITSATIATGITVYQANTGSVIPSGTFVFVTTVRAGGGKKFVISRYC